MKDVNSKANNLDIDPHILDVDVVEFLAQNDICISDANYKKTSNYEKLKYEWVLSEFYDAMTLEEYIERFLLDREQVAMTYESVYEMGNTRILSENDCSYKKLSEEIACVLDLSGIQSDDINPLSFNSQGGLIDKIKDRLKFDIRAFDESNKQYQCEIFKILYFFQTLIKHNPNIRIMELLGKASMENIDNSILEKETKNGKIIQQVNASISKEVSLEVKRHMRQILKSILSEWEAFLFHIPMAVEILRENRRRFDFVEAINMLSVFPEAIKEIGACHTYTCSPMEALNLAMMRLELNGYISDVIFTNTTEVHTKVGYAMPTEWIEQMRELNTRRIALSRIKEYLERSAADIEDFVYLKPAKNKDVGKNRRRRLKKAETLEKLLIIMEILQVHKPEFFDNKGYVSELLVISCLQSMYSDSRSQQLPYTFHGSQKHTKHLHINAALYNDFGVVPIYWVRKVVERWNANIGMTDFRDSMRELEVVCYNILLCILEKSDIDNMKKIHDTCIREAYKKFGLDSKPLLEAYAMEQLMMGRF